MMHSAHGGGDWHGSGFHHGHGRVRDEDSATGASRFHGHPGSKILGTAVVGERGQVVIPREARDELGIESGDRFVVFGDKTKSTVTLVKADVFNHFAEVFMTKSKKLEQMAQEIWETTQAAPVADEADEKTEDDAEKGESPQKESAPSTAPRL